MCPNFFFLNLIFFGFWVSYLKDVLERKEVAFLEVPLGDEPGQALHTRPHGSRYLFQGVDFEAAILDAVDGDRFPGPASEGVPGERTSI